MPRYLQFSKHYQKKIDRLVLDLMVIRITNRIIFNNLIFNY